MDNVKKLPGGPNITRVLHQVTIQIVELDNDPKAVQIALLNPQQVPTGLVLVMLQDSLKVLAIMAEAEKAGSL
jgi:hypothetical protein